MCVAKCAGVEVNAQGPCKVMPTVLSPLQPFSFSKKGNSVKVPGDTNRECNGASSFKADAPRLALAVDKRQGHCWYNGNYNDRDFSIQPGLVSSFRAYQIDGPQTKAKNFAASENTIWLSFEKAGTYKIYLLDKSGGLQERGTVTATTADAFVKIPVVTEGTITLVVAPASTRASMWPLLGTGVEGAMVWQDSNFKVTAHRWDVSAGQPFNPATDILRTPGWGGYSGTTKYFFPVSNNGQEGVVWQDQKTLKIFLSWFATDFSAVSNIELTTNNVNKPVLNAAAGNGKGEVIGLAWG